MRLDKSVKRSFFALLLVDVEKKPFRHDCEFCWAMELEVELMNKRTIQQRQIWPYSTKYRQIEWKRNEHGMQHQIIHVLPRKFQNSITKHWRLRIFDTFTYIPRPHFQLSVYLCVDTLERDRLCVSVCVCWRFCVCPFCINTPMATVNDILFFSSLRNLSIWTSWSNENKAENRFLFSSG